MAWIRCVTEMGMGVDVHGLDYTTAATRAVFDALHPGSGMHPQNGSLQVPESSAKALANSGEAFEFRVFPCASAMCSD